MSCILVSRSIGGVFVDVVISEEHESEMEIADHPVEQGTKISDHAWLLPYKVILESVVDGPRAVAAFQQLLAVQKAAEPFTLITGLKVCQNMMIQKLNPIRDREHPRVLKFTAELREVRIVSTESSGGTSADDKAQTTTQRGQVSARTSQSIPATTNSILDNAKAVD
ncbi:MAG TPA: hypothetical protein VGN82_14200 [Bosea sp. (in: a-proteobacteria)]|jgi:hypothetical protein|uniref:phage baseplate protein n=1 Tax=Bosea sp. (in: a-proteobacteria) TaxID=1871050 RepID=UPI002E163BC1|nr:hypothetical protein [Bosea sp. (in: a-proteobacteria)]